MDGVVLVGEHGNYPRNEKGQTKYPRYEFFKQIVEVFRASGRSRARSSTTSTSPGIGSGREEMYDTSRELKFPFMAGSSLPVTWRTPSVEMPLGARISEALCVCYGGVDSYDFHGLETIQCMVERRRGGETGVKWIQAYRGDKFWEALREGVWPKALMDAALCRSHTLVPARAGLQRHLPDAWTTCAASCRDPVAYRYEHTDGLKCTMLLMNGLVRDFNFAAYVNGSREPWSTQMYLPMPDGRTTLAEFLQPAGESHGDRCSSPAKPPYPIERTLLTTGLTAAGVESLFRGQTRYETPHLAIRYQPTKESTFWRT